MTCDQCRVIQIQVSAGQATAQQVELCPLHERTEALVEALIKYGRHLIGCKWCDMPYDATDKNCTCGFTTILKEGGTDG